MRIPFELDEVHGGLSEAVGHMYLEDGFLIFHVQLKVLSFIEREPELIKVEIGVIDSIRFERGIWKDKIYIAPKGLALLKAMPGSHTGELKLKISRKHRNRAEQFVEDVEAVKAFRNT